MAIVAVDPKDWAAANVVQVDSDVNDNHEAILEIEDWAAETEAGSASFVGSATD